MSKTFDLLGFAAHLGKATVAMAVEEHHALTRAAEIIEREAKAEIGTYQGAAGPFVKWEALADATKQDRKQQGFSEDEPLLRTGALRDSIEHTVRGNEAHVGSDSDVALYQELGTHGGGWGGPIPPRSFLGGAAFRKAPEVAHEIGRDIAGVLAGGGKRTLIG